MKDKKCKHSLTQSITCESIKLSLEFSISLKSLETLKWWYLKYNELRIKRLYDTTYTNKGIQFYSFENFFFPQKLWKKEIKVFL